MNEYPLLNEVDTMKANRQINFRMIEGTQLHHIKRENDRMEGAIIKINSFIKPLCYQQEYDAFIRDMMDIDFGKVE